VIVDADRQHAVFGSSGALAIGLVAGVLHARRGRPATTDESFAPVATAAPTGSLAGRRAAPVR
jgi:hypothetical protein